MVLTILKNMKVNGKDYPIYYGKNHVWNRQPDNLIYIYIYIFIIIYNYSEWGVRINWGASPCRFCLLIRVVRMAAQCFLMPSPRVFKAWNIYHQKTHIFEHIFIYVAHVLFKPFSGSSTFKWSCIAASATNEHWTSVKPTKLLVLHKRLWNAQFEW